MAIYQRKEESDSVTDLKIRGSVQGRSITDMPQTVTSLMDCPKPSKSPPSPAYASYSPSKEHSMHFSLSEYAWLLAKVLPRAQDTTESHLDAVSDESMKSAQSAAVIDIMECDNDGEAIDQTDRDVEQNHPVHIPVWSGYQSKVNPVMPSTLIGAPPL